MFVDEIKWHRFYDSFDALRERIPELGIAHFKVNKTAVVVARTQSGFYAVRDRCPHQLQSFRGGACTEDERIVCPVHRFSFDLKTGRGHNTAVDTYPLEERKDGVYMGFPYVAFRQFRRKRKSGNDPAAS